MAPQPLAPATVEIIIEAYDAAIAELAANGMTITERIRTDVARTIIELAEHGNHHPRRLKAATLARFSGLARYS
jgi:hypothetical protein